MWLHQSNTVTANILLLILCRAAWGKFTLPYNIINTYIDNLNPYKLKMIFYMIELYYEILSNNNLRLITSTVVWLSLTESILPMICSLRLTHLMIWMMTRMVVIRWIIRRLLCSYVSHYCYQFDGLISSLEMSFFCANYFGNKEKIELIVNMV